jgi:peptidyl-prolyl cis-trans isomerase C
MRRWVRAPLAMVLGGLLVGGLALGRRLRPSLAATVPPARAITVGASELAGLRRSFTEGHGRPPKNAELAQAVRGLVREEALWREAVALGLAPHNPSARQGVIDELARSTRAAAAPPPPTEAQVNAWFAAHADRYAQQERISFTQLFIDERRRGSATTVAARARLAALREGDERQAGDPCVFPTRWEQKSQAEIAHLLGTELAGKVVALPAGVWTGPLRSPFGLHLVRVTGRAPARTPALAEIRPQVLADLEVARTAEAADALEARLVARHPVAFDAEAARLLASSR